MFNYSYEDEYVFNCFSKFKVIDTKKEKELIEGKQFKYLKYVLEHKL